MTHYMEYVIHTNLLKGGELRKIPAHIWFNDDASLDWYMNHQIAPQWMSVRVYHGVQSKNGQALIGGKLFPVSSVYAHRDRYNRNGQSAPYIVIYPDGSYKRTKCREYTTRNLTECWCFSKHGAEKIAKEINGKCEALLTMIKEK